MRVGVVYPQTELGGDPGAVRQIGRAVEDLGFDHILASDHVLGAVHANRARRLTGPYTEHDPFHDPFVLFAYLAGLTELTPWKQSCSCRRTHREPARGPASALVGL